MYMCVDVGKANHVSDREDTGLRGGGREGQEEEESEGVFADGFSDEGEDFIGDLESEVMRTAYRTKMRQ